MAFFVLLFYNFLVGLKFFPSKKLKKKKPSNYNYDLKRKGGYVKKSMQILLLLLWIVSPLKFVYGK